MKKIIVCLFCAALFLCAGCAASQSSGSYGMQELISHSDWLQYASRITFAMEDYQKTGDQAFLDEAVSLLGFMRKNYVNRDEVEEEVYDNLSAVMEFLEGTDALTDAEIDALITCMKAAYEGADSPEWAEALGVYCDTLE